MQASAAVIALVEGLNSRKLTSKHKAKNMSSCIKIIAGCFLNG